MFNKFWDWYQRHYRVNLIITTFLFLLQVFHLYWLFTDVVLFRLTGTSYFFLDQIWGQVSIFFDYTEIPAIISTSILYIHHLRQGFRWRPLMYLLMINIQWLHILWITDEYVIEALVDDGSLFVWGATLAWIAIAIDYLELPVIWDTVRQSIREIKKYLQEKNQSN